MAPGHHRGRDLRPYARAHVVRCRSGNAKVYIQADVTNLPLFVRNPDWHLMFDQDAQAAEATRRKVYDMLAAEKMMVQGFHYPFPALAYIEKAGNGLSGNSGAVESGDLARLPDMRRISSIRAAWRRLAVFDPSIHPPLFVWWFVCYVWIEACKARRPLRRLRSVRSCRSPAASSSTARQAKLGIDLAVKEINAGGGILGRPVEVVYEDDKTDPAVASDATRKLIERDGVLAVVGPITSRNLNAIAPEVETPRRRRCSMPPTTKEANAAGTSSHSAPFPIRSSLSCCPT